MRKDTSSLYLQKAEENIKNKKYLEAVSDLQEFEKKDPKNILMPKSLLLTGEAYFKYSVVYRESVFFFDEETRNKYFDLLQKARDSFDRIIKEYSQSDFAGDAQFNIGLIYDWDQLGGTNNFSQALIEYQKVIDNYPDSPAYSKAKERIKLIKSFYEGLEGTPHDVK